MKHCLIYSIVAYATQKIVNRLNAWESTDNKQSQQRDLQKKIVKQIDVYGSLLEGKRHQSPAKPDKIKFLNEPKQTELELTSKTKT